MKFAKGFQAAIGGLLRPSEGRRIKDEGWNYRQQIKKILSRFGITSPLAPTLSPRRGEGAGAAERRRLVRRLFGLKSKRGEHCFALRFFPAALFLILFSAHAQTNWQPAPGAGIRAARSSD